VPRKDVQDPRGVDRAGWWPRRRKKETMTTAELLALGATRPEFQPGNGDWVVLADPAGHVFCLVPE
jgi:hypothetical protein